MRALELEVNYDFGRSNSVSHMYLNSESDQTLLIAVKLDYTKTICYFVHKKNERALKGKRVSQKYFLYKLLLEYKQVLSWCLQCSCLHSKIIV